MHKILKDAIRKVLWKNGTEKGAVGLKSRSDLQLDDDAQTSKARKWGETFGRYNGQAYSAFFKCSSLFPVVRASDQLRRE